MAQHPSLWRGNPIHDRFPDERTRDQEYFAPNDNVQEDDLHHPAAQLTRNVPQFLIDRAVADLDATLHERKRGLALQLALDRTQFLAGDQLTGTFTLQCTSSRRLMLGKIELSLYGFEEVLDGSKQRTRRLFLYTTKLLQGPLLAPTDAVVPCHADPEGYWQARKGTTQFDLSLRIPAHTNMDFNRCIALSGSRETLESATQRLPSSFFRPRAGGIRYFVRVSVEAKYRARVVPNVGFFREICIIEDAKPEYALANAYATAYYAADFAGRTHARVERAVSNGWLRKSGRIAVDVNLHAPSNLQRAVGAWVAGCTNYVSVRIQNSSQRTVGKVVLRLVQKVHISGTEKARDTMRTVVATKVFYADGSLGRSAGPLNARVSAKLPWARLAYKTQGVDRQSAQRSWQGVAPGTTRTAVLDFFTPADLYSIAHAELVRVSFVVEVDCGLALVASLPIDICHPLSLMANHPPLELQSIASPEAVLHSSHASSVALEDAPMTVLEPAQQTRLVLQTPLVDNVRAGSASSSHSATPHELAPPEQIKTPESSTAESPIASAWVRNVAGVHESHGLLPATDFAVEPAFGHEKYLSSQTQQSYAGSTLGASFASYPQSSASLVSVPQYQRHLADAAPMRSQPALLVQQQPSQASLASSLRGSASLLGPRRSPLSDKISTIRRRRSLAIDLLIEKLRTEDESEAPGPSQVPPKLTTLQASFDSQTTIVHDLSAL